MATQKQKLVAKRLLEKPGTSVSQAMADVGYKPGAAKNPQDLTRSKGWAELMEEFLPDSLLAEKHQALLNKKETIAIGKKGEREVLVTDEIDGFAVARGLDLAYKLKGSYKPVQVDVRSFTGWTPQELDDYAANGVIPERFIDAGEGESRA